MSAASVLPLAHEGLRLFPLKVRDKEPVIVDWPNQATDRAEQLELWATRFPGCNWGVACGPSSDLFAVDFDGERGRITHENWISQHGHEWTKTRTVKTSRGCHLYYKWPEGARIRNSASKIAPGVDIRGEGGYVVVPPSIHPAGPAYTWADPATPIAEAPPWLVDLVVKASRESEPREKASSHSEGKIPEGQRNDTLTSLAGSMRRRGMDAETILAALQLHNAVYCDPPLTEGEVQQIANSVGRYQPAHAPLTEDGLALIFADLYQKHWRYVFLWNKWLQYDRVWTPDVALKVFNLSREITRGASLQCTEKESSTSKWLRSAKTVAAVLRLAQADPRLAATPENFDFDHWTFNTGEGTVELKGGTLREHRAEDYLTKIAPVTPKIADTPVWNAFLDRVTDGDVELQRYLQRVAGYCLTGDTREHAMFFLYGTGANGKGTFTNTLLGIWGDYGQTAVMEMFTENKSDRHPTELAALRGARLVVASETDRNKRWAESRIKALTGGDPIRARFMHCDEFEFIPAFKLMIQGNHKPGLQSVDEAMRRRLHLVPFTVTIPPEERDLKLKEKLRTEWPAILQWGDQWLRSLATGRTKSSERSPQGHRGLLCDRRCPLVLDGGALHRFRARGENQVIRPLSGLQDLGRASRGKLRITKRVQPKLNRSGLQGKAVQWNLV